MEVGKAIFVLAITMVLSISTLTMMINDAQDQGSTKMSTNPNSITTNYHHQENNFPPPSKRVSRFLRTSNPRASDRCRRGKAVCTAGRRNETCCRNRCVDLLYDDDNCGACGERCFYTETCCRGECVYLAYDPRHCGQCNSRCQDQDVCFYGMCNYARS